MEHLGEWENSEEPSSNSRRKLLKTGWVTDSQQLNVGSNVEIRVDDVKQCIVKEKDVKGELTACLKGSLTNTKKDGVFEVALTHTTLKPNHCDYL